MPIVGQNKLKVFISGKENELPSERKFAIEAVELLGMLPIGTENRTASDKSISDKYESELHDSDIYVGIFGMIDSFPSRDEFYIARNRKIPTLVFEKKINLNETRDKLLQDFLDVIKNPIDGVTVGEYSDILDLRNKITDSLRQLIFDKFQELAKQEKSRKESIIIEQKTLSPTKPNLIPIGIKCDKSVYPNLAKVYMRARIPSLIVGEPIIFEITNSSQVVIFYQKMNPTDSEMPELREHGIYQTSFQMKKGNCMDKDTLLIKAQHGNDYSYDYSTVSQRTPIIQSDKSVYDWNSDMILTVIDPDANKDSMMEEYVGDRIDSKLIISSSKGQLVNYRLKETGKNTGIFQAILGFIGVSNDGNTRGRKIEGKMITTTQGTELTDGFIECSDNEQIFITYRNHLNTAELTCYVKDLSFTQNLKI